MVFDNMMHYLPCGVESVPLGSGSVSLLGRPALLLRCMRCTAVHHRARTPASAAWSAFALLSWVQCL